MLIYAIKNTEKKMKRSDVLQAQKLRYLCLIFLVTLALCAVFVSQHTLFAQDEKTKAIKPESVDHPLEELFPGSVFISPDIKAMQENPAQNPASLWQKRGATLWEQVEGEEQKACVSCHNKAEVSMKTIGFRYPLYNEAQKRLITLEDRINLCRQRFMKAPAFPAESNDQLAMSIYVRNQSFGLPMRIKTAGPAKPHFEYGKELYYRQRGQLNVSCASCHQDNAGKMLRGTKLSQGHINGYPAYRLSWQKPGSALRRVNACNTLIRAKHFSPGSKEALAIELYLTWRGQGLPLTTPAVRK